MLHVRIFANLRYETRNLKIS